MTDKYCDNKTGESLYYYRKKEPLKFPIYLIEDINKWKVVKDKVCYGEYISPNRVGYGQKYKDSKQKTKDWCMNNPDCQAYHFDPGDGYYYYTGKDLQGNLMDESNDITDYQNGVCTETSSKDEKGAVLYIKKSNEEIAAEKAKKFEQKTIGTLSDSLNEIYVEVIYKPTINKKVTFYLLNQKVFAMISMLV